MMDANGILVLGLFKTREAAAQDGGVHCKETINLGLGGCFLKKKKKNPYF
jgi:hypothetical protein